MPVEAIIALFSLGLTILTGFGVIMWRIARWQARSEVYSRTHAAGIDGINTRLDKLNSSVSSQGERIAHLEGRVD